MAARKNENLIYATPCLRYRKLSLLYASYCLSVYSQNTGNSEKPSRRVEGGIVGISGSRCRVPSSRWRLQLKFRGEQASKLAPADCSELFVANEDRSSFSAIRSSGGSGKEEKRAESF